MKVYLSSDGNIEFLDGATINRNTLNRKKLEVTLEQALTAYESLWVQFGDSEDYDESANILEPVRLEKVDGEANQYFKLLPDEVVMQAGTWYMVLAVRKYSADSTVYSENLTSEQVSFIVNDNFPVKDGGYVSNASMESYYYDTVAAAEAAQEAKEEVEAKIEEVGIDSINEAVASAESAAEEAKTAAKNAADDLRDDYFGNTYSVDSTTTVIDYTLEKYVDKSFTASGIESVKLTVPASVTHGFYCDVNIKTGDDEVAISIKNNSSYPIKYLNLGSQISKFEKLAADSVVTLMFECNGTNINCYILEVTN